MTDFHIGDAVRLTPRFAETLSRSPKNRVDWKKRRGVVRSRRNADSVCVLWDGLSSVEVLPVKAIERIQMTKCQARPTRFGNRCDVCRISWDNDDEAPPCPRTQIAQRAHDERLPAAPYVSALAPDRFQR